VKEGDLVLITGRSQDAELLEDIAVNVRKAGGFPMIEYSSDRLAKRLFFDVPEKYDTQVPGWGSKLAGGCQRGDQPRQRTTENLFEGARSEADGRPRQGRRARRAGNAEEQRPYRGDRQQPVSHPMAGQRLGMAEGELATCSERRQR